MCTAKKKKSKKKRKKKGQDMFMSRLIPELGPLSASLAGLPQQRPR